MNASRKRAQKASQGDKHNAGQGAPQEVQQGILLSQQSVRQMRRNLHELANTLTGVMIAGGLLTQYLEGGSLAGYAADVCEATERGSHLVRELRGYLLAAYGEMDAGGGLTKPEAGHGEAATQ